MTVEQWLGENNTLGIDIFNHKYLFTDPDTGEQETFDEWLERVSNGNEDVKKLILEKKFLFGGRILANRGLHKKGFNITYSNCYVVTPPDDNIESIFETAKKMARTYSYGGGVGVDISGLAPHGAKVHNASRTSSGAVSFMDLYSTTTGLIGQNGRRGALMISLSSEHPDLEEFIDIKKDLTRVTKANISVRMSDKFMEAAEKGEDVELSFTRETGETITKTVNARDILMHLAENNWGMAEPGCLFWDRIENWSIVSEDPNFKFASVNPCAEEPLPAGGSCLLGSINLAEFVNENGEFQNDIFEDAVAIGVKALNEVLMEGLPLHPLQEQRDSVNNWRQIGLGIMGLADMLIKMGIRYGSQEAIDICDTIGNIMAKTAITMSSYIACAEMQTYPKFNRDAVLSSPYILEHIDDTIHTEIEDYGLYNSQLLTIAPTGTLSTMLGVSGGIEPIFANYYTRKTESLKGHDEYYKVYTPIVKDYMDKHDISDDADLPDFFVTAGELDYRDRIAMQAVWQKHIDAAISSTVNLAHETTVEQVFDLYIQAWKAGLKGITVFRDGCSRVPILSNDSSDSDGNENDESGELQRGYIIPASDNLIGLKRTVISGCGTLHVEGFFTRDSGELRELYLSKGSKGGCNSFMTGISRMISLAARGGVPFENIIDQLHSTIVCPSFAVRTATKHDTSRGSSCPSAIGHALVEMKEDMDNFLKTMEKGEAVEAVEMIFDEGDLSDVGCPVCGSKELRNTEGCVTCPNCGWSKCS